MRITVFILFLVAGNILSAQTKHQVFEAIRKVDMQTLSTMFDNKVEYCFDDHIQFLDKNSTLKALKAFLDRNTPKSVTPMHEGASKSEESNFAIAILESTNNRKYRLYVYAENSGGKLLVQELRIDIQK
jgi:hypothetical protein